MEANTTTTQSNDNQATPNPDLQSLNRLIGTWQLGDDTKGTVTYEWMAGSFFLIQHFDFTLHGHSVKGIEVIGHLQPFGEAPGPDIRSRVYDSVGNTLDYVYEIQDDTLFIWGGEKGSPAYYKGQFSEDGDTIIGGWVYPGGGYASVMTRIK